MYTVALNLHGKSIPVQIQMCRVVVEKMTGNANFATPNPDLDVVTKAINLLEDDYQAAADGGHSLKEEMGASREALLALMSTLAAYVQTTSKGDKGVILSSGMAVKSKPAPITLTRPQNPRVVLNGHDGALKPRWKKVKGAKSYVIQMYAETPATGTGTTATAEESNNWNWQNLGTSSKTSYEANDLVSGTKYWFRIAAVGASGTGGWSNAVAMIAP